MTLQTQLEIDLLAFIKTSRFDYVRLGQTKEWLLNNFPDPDGSYEDFYESPIWFYGNIEFHFSKDDNLFLIFCDHLDSLDGGKSLKLDKWIFNKSENLTLENVTYQLAKEKIGYQLEYITIQGFTSALVQIITSKVKLKFVLPETEEEDFANYLERTNTENSNLYQLVSFSLIDK